jgi:hypothetical protein
MSIATSEMQQQSNQEWKGYAEMIPQQVEGSSIATMSGPRGIFGIAFVGASREGLRYFYSNGEQSFFFYANVKSKPIWTVSVEPTSGLIATPEAETRIRANIEFFFKSRNYSRPDKEAIPGTEAQVVTFQWPSDG